MKIAPHQLIQRNQDRRRFFEIPYIPSHHAPAGLPGLPGNPIVITSDPLHAKAGLAELQNVGDCHVKVYNNAGDLKIIAPGHRVPDFPGNPSATRIEMAHFGMSDEGVAAQLWVTFKYLPGLERPEVNPQRPRPGDQDL
ncbi:MAG TPA: hypothetical protein VJ302_19190 [Blastocatellia bacterium]|nr:hypothetical protein [Blastocatellia bacterium]